MKAGYPGHDAMREKAERAFGAAELRGYDKPAKPSDCYKGGGRMHHGRVKKDIGGEIQKAGVMGLPSYLIEGVGDAIRGLKSGGKAHHKPVRRNMGGMMSTPGNTADSIQQANQLLSNASRVPGFIGDTARGFRPMSGPSGSTGLKRGGKAHHGMRHKRADGGAMNAMGERDFTIGKKAMGLNHGGRPGKHNVEIEIEFMKKKKSGGQMYRDGGKMCHREMGGEIKKAIGGVGKIRHGQMTKKGAQIAPRARFKG